MSPFVALLAHQAPDAYVQLGARLPKSDWKRTLDAVASSPPGTTPLAVQRAATERWAAVLDGLRTISEAPYTPGPPASEGRDAVERVAGLVATAARVRLADGQPPSAVTLLLDGLTMAVRVRSEDAEGIVLASFATHLDAIPLAQCDRVRLAIDGFPAAKDDRRLCLLRLHMRIEAYRWRYLKPPTLLTDAAPAAETTDPATRKRFRYVVKGARYRLYGDSGGPGGDPIELGSEGKP